MDGSTLGRFEYTQNISKLPNFSQFLHTMYPIFDVFLSRKSEDAPLASKLYKFLESRGYSVFDSSLTIPRLSSSNYRQVIDNALESSTHLIVIASCAENLRSRWVEFEWGFFSNEIRSNRKHGNLISVVDFPATSHDLPPALRVHEFLEYNPDKFDQILNFLPIVDTGGNQFTGIATNSKGRSDAQERRSESKYLTKKPALDFKVLINRASVLQDVYQLSEKHHKLAITGYGGIGKTTLIKMYARHYSREFKYIFWIDLVSDLYSSFFNQIDFSRTGFKYNIYKSESENYESIVKEINNMDGQKLIIVDNINENSDLKKLYAHNFSDCRIILTSRSHQGYFMEYMPDRLTIDEAKELFYSYYHKNRDDDNLEKLLTLIGFHTLMTELMAKIAEAIVYLDIKMLLDLYIRKGLSAKEFNTFTIPIFYNQQIFDLQVTNFIFDIFSLSELSDFQKSVLSQFAIFPPVGLSYSKITFLFFQDHLLPSAPLQDNETTDLEFSIALNSLLQKGWISKEGQDFRLHPIIQEVLKQKLDISPENCLIPIKKIKKILQEAKNKIVYTDYKVLKDSQINEYIDYAVSISEFFRDEKSELVAELNFYLSFLLQKLLRHEDALQYQNRCLVSLTESSSENKILLGNSYDNLGWIYRELADFTNAVESLNRSLTIKQDVIFFSRADTAFTYHRLAGVYISKGELKPARKLLHKAIAIREKQLGKTDLATVNSYHDLAALYTILGEADQAKIFLDKVLPVRDSQIPISIDTANTYSIYSSLLTLQDDFRQALQKQQKAHLLYTSVLYEGHWRIGRSYSKLSAIHSELRNHRLAQKLQQTALTIMEDTLGSQNPQTAYAYNVSAFVYFNKRDVDTALKFQKKAIEVYENTSYKYSMELGHSYWGYANILSGMGEIQTAMAYLQRAKKIYLYNCQPDNLYVQRISALEKRFANL